MADTTAEDIRNLGPLGPLVGVWEGEKGGDLAPADDRGVENNAFREHLVLDPIGCVDNHEQRLYGLRYATTAWRIGADNPFHEEVGYWLWDAGNKQVLRCFIVPRGVAVIAGGTAEPDATSFTLSAEAGSETYGICNNQFLETEFKTLRYDLTVTVNGDGSFSYEEDTQLRLKGRDDIFHHTDANTLRQV